MKIQVEILRKTPYLDSGMGFFYKLDEQETVIFTLGDKNTRVQNAIDRLNELKNSLPLGDKIRVLEYHNDDTDNIRESCKILYE